MHPTGTETAQCLLFINHKAEQRETSHFVALAKEKDLEKEGEQQVQHGIQQSSFDFSLLFFFFFFFFHFQKDPSILEKVH